MRRVFLFLTDKPSLDGTGWQERIDHVIATSGEKSGPYVPRSGKIGASFRHFSDEQFQYVLKTANLPLRGFGYDPATQNFPNDIQLPRRQVKPGNVPDAVLEISNDIGLEIRKKNDSFGRFSTWFRKALVDPVIASDGSELNMDEVLLAREKAKQEKESQQQQQQQQPSVNE